MRQLICDLGEVLQPRRAFRQVPLEPPKRRPLVFRGAPFGVQVDELQRVLELEVRELAGCVLG